MFGMENFPLFRKKEEEKEADALESSSVIASKISQETGLSENALAWFLQDLRNGDVAELDLMINEHHLEGILSRPDVLVLAKEGISKAEKEKDDVSANLIKSLLKL